MLSLRGSAHASRIITDLPAPVRDVFPARLVLPTSMTLTHRRSAEAEYEVTFSWRICVNSYMSETL